MTVYQHRATVTASSGATSSTTLKVRGGLLRQFLIQANTSSTVFRANIVDDSSLTVMNWGFSTGLLNETGIALPLAGAYTINITNASPDDTFKVYFSIEE